MMSPRSLEMRRQIHNVQNGDDLATMSKRRASSRKAESGASSGDASETGDAGAVVVCHLVTWN